MIFIIIINYYYVAATLLLVVNTCKLNLIFIFKCFVYVLLRVNIVHIRQLCVKLNKPIAVAIFRC